MAGIVGGLIVGVASGSKIGVSGPAVGLSLVVLDGLTILGSFEAMLVAIIIAGVIQVLLVFLSAGYLAGFFPSCVVKGMLSGIGVVLVIKQLPFFLGIDFDHQGLVELFDLSGIHTTHGMMAPLQQLDTGVFCITLVSLGAYLIWEYVVLPNYRQASMIPSSLMVILTGIAASSYFDYIPHLSLDATEKVSIPVLNSLGALVQSLPKPDMSAWRNPQVYVCGLLVAVVASIETLLSAEAMDKQTVKLRNTPLNRELKAQGLGNIICACL